VLAKLGDEVLHESGDRRKAGFPVVEALSLLLPLAAQRDELARVGLSRHLSILAAGRANSVSRVTDVACPASHRAGLQSRHGFVGAEHDQDVAVLQAVFRAGDESPLEPGA
jgi:hypothetical protein